MAEDKKEIKKSAPKKEAVKKAAPKKEGRGNSSANSSWGELF